MSSTVRLLRYCFRHIAVGGCSGGCRLSLLRSCHAQGNDKWCTLHLVNNCLLVQSMCHDFNNFLLKNDSFIMATHVPSEYCGPCHDQVKYMILSYEYFFTFKKVGGSYSETCIILSNSIWLKRPKIYRIWSLLWLLFCMIAVIILHARFWLLIGLVWFFVHPVSHTCNIGHVNYRLQFIYYNTTFNIWTSTQYNIINNNTKCKDQLEVECVTTSIYIYIYIYIYLYKYT